MTSLIPLQAHFGTILPGITTKKTAIAYLQILQEYESVIRDLLFLFDYRQKSALHNREYFRQLNVELVDVQKMIEDATQKLQELSG